MLVAQNLRFSALGLTDRNLGCGILMHNKKRLPKAFLRGERVVLLFESIKFFRPSTCFRWSDGLDNQNNVALNSL